MTVDRITRRYLRSDRWANAALRMGRGVFDGIWLGLLSREQLARIDHRYYDEAPEYLTESHNLRGLFGWERDAVERHFGGVRSIVVTSAGGGREMLALAKAGYQVAGYEPHLELTRFGNQLLAREGANARIHACARDVWPPAAEPADAVVVGWSGYMLTQGRAARVEFLRGAARHLPPGAPVLVSFFAAEYRDVRLRTAARLGTRLRRLRGREPVQLGDALLPNLVHFFSRDELAAEFADGGIDLIDFGDTDCGWAVGQTRPVQEEEHDHELRESQAARGSGGVATDRRRDGAARSG
jgi:hypothetical protein